MNSRVNERVGEFATFIFLNEIWRKQNAEDENEAVEEENDEEDEEN